MRRLLPLVLAAAPSASLLHAQQAERFTLSGSDVAVYNLVGKVRVVGGAAPGAAVAEVTRGGPDAASLRVETGPIGSHQTLRVIYPGDAVLVADMGRWSTTRLRVRDDGTFGDGDRGRWAGRQVTIGGGGTFRSGLDARADITLRIPDGEHVLLHLAVGEATLTNVDGDIRVDVEAARVTATGVRGRLSLDAGAGDLRVSDVEGELEIDAGSGDATISRVRGRSLVVDAGSGSLDGSDVAVDRLALDVGSGGARLSKVRASDISLDTGSGSVDLGLAAGIRRLDVDSGSGSITIRVPASLGAVVDVDAGSGGVETEVPMTITHRSHSELAGQIGDGKGRIRVDAGSGRVVFRKS